MKKVTSLLFSTLSRFVIAFLPRSKQQDFMSTVTIHSDFGAQENKICHYFHIFPHLSTKKWWDQVPSSWFFESWVVSQLYHSPLWLSSRGSLVPLSAIRTVSSAYLRLLIFLPAILFPACESSSPAFHMMYSAYKLNKQAENIQPWCTPF